MRSIGDPEFSPPLTSPFAPGASRFRQKGNAFLGDFVYFDTCVPGGAKAVLKNIADDATRAFLSQKFIASEWYDAFPNLTMQLTAARLRGISFEEHRRKVGIYHAESMSGVYRALLRMVSNESVATWGPRIAALYWDFGKTQTRVAGPKDVIFIRSGTPKALLQWCLWASTAFVESTLRIAGAQAAKTSIEAIEDEPKQAGQDMCTVKVRITWW